VASTRGLDCTAFNSYTASLASYTIDCLGTIGPRSFAVDKVGYLRRNFETCVQKDTRQSVDDLLGIQHRERLFPNAKECIAGRWAEWKTEFEQRSVQACPLWRKDEAVGARGVPPTLGRFGR